MYKKACVLKGGISSEREISLLTAKSYEDSLTDLGYEFISLDTAVPVDELISKIKTFQPNVVVNALHGKYGEDGRIQSLLDFMKIPYTHSGALASFIAMNKNITKIIAKSVSVISPKSVLTFDPFNHEIKIPYVIKPIDDGSSFGVRLILNDNDLKNANDCHYESKEYLIEEYIKGQEVTVGIIDGKPIAVTAIDNTRQFYDYDAKYSNGCLSAHILPAPIDSCIYDKVMQNTKLVYDALGLRGVARADFIVSSEDSEAYFLEINSQPGMTYSSLVPEQVKFQYGWDMKTLVKKCIELAKYDK